MSKGTPGGPKWKKFERLVAAIHYTEYQGGQVRWDETINGRQFDVTVRFAAGPYSFLTVIECKNIGRPVSVEKIDAFVTKSSDAKANKAVMVSSAGFQEGAKIVAQRHGVEIFTLEQVNEDNQPLINDLIPELYIYEALAFEPNGTQGVSLAGSNGLSPKRFAALTIRSKDSHCPLSGLLYEMASKLVRGELYNKTVEDDNIITLAFPAGAKITFPSGEEMALDRIALRYVLPDVRITSPGFNKEHKAGELRLTNVLTAEHHSYHRKSLPLGFDTVLEAGKFYTLLDTGFGTYCDKIDGDNVSMILVEAYRYGVFIQAEMKHVLGAAKAFLEVTDVKQLEHLRTLLSFYRSKKHQNIFALGINPVEALTDGHFPDIDQSAGT